MTLDQILSLGPQLADFLGEFNDCFARSEPRGHLASYVKGQLSDLPRKSVQPIADFTDTPRRTLQEFLDWSPWDRGLVRDRVQQLVVRDHADPQAIGIIDAGLVSANNNGLAITWRQQAHESPGECPHRQAPVDRRRVRESCHGDGGDE